MSEPSDISIAMSVFFKPTPWTPTKALRPRLKTQDSPSIEKSRERLFSKQQKAEKNRERFIWNRVRTLSNADELRLEKLDALNDQTHKTAERINKSQTRAIINRDRMLSERSERLKRRHTLIESQIFTIKRERLQARTKLSVVVERKGANCTMRRNERIWKIRERAKILNKQVTERVLKVKQEEKKLNDVKREQWEEKIERAREKRQQLLQQKMNIA